MSEPFNLAQLTKEMVVHQLKNLEDPARIVAEVVRGTLVARVKNPNLSESDLQDTVREVCKGAASGMLLMEMALPRGFAKTLQAAQSFAKTVGKDEETVKIAALKGLADIRRFVDTTTLTMIADKLNETRPGAGEVFLHFSGNPQPYQSHPDYVPPKL
jgi:hypothetical protein